MHHPRHPIGLSRRSIASPSTASQPHSVSDLVETAASHDVRQRQRRRIKTGRGGWINGRFDEIFLLINNRLSCITLWDAHHIVTDIQQQADPLSIGAMYEARWQLTKVEVFDGKDEAGNNYFRREPHFELLRLAGQPSGPSEAELANAKKLSAPHRVN